MIPVKQTIREEIINSPKPKLYYKVKGIYGNGTIDRVDIRYMSDTLCMSASLRSYLMLNVYSAEDTLRQLYDGRAIVKSDTATGQFIFSSV